MSGLRPLFDRPRARRACIHLPARPPASRSDAAGSSLPFHEVSRVRLGLVMFVQYALLAFDIRFIAEKNYVGVLVVNALIACNTWYLTRGVVQARTGRDRVWYVAGGTCGAVLAAWLA